QSKLRADEVGVGKLYMDYAESILNITRKHGKKALMWGDVLSNHPEVLEMLPNDVTVLEWNYESHVSFEKNSKLLQEKGISYYVCPGTSSWSSIAGRTDNMLNNIT